jgi:hypothetical protein
MCGVLFSKYVLGGGGWEGNWNYVDYVAFLNGSNSIIYLSVQCKCIYFVYLWHDSPQMG